MAIRQRCWNTHSGENGIDGEDRSPVVRLQLLDCFSRIQGLEPRLHIFHSKGVRRRYAEGGGIVLGMLHEDDFSRSPWIEYEQCRLPFHARNNAAERNESSRQKKNDSKEAEETSDARQKGPAFLSRKKTEEGRQREQDREAVQIRQQPAGKLNEERRNVRHFANERSSHGVEWNGRVSDDCEGKEAVDC